MEVKLRLTVGSDTEFNDLIASIESDDGLLIGVMSQEEGFDKLKIHFPTSIDASIKNPEDMLTVNLEEFEDVLRRGKERLWQLRKDEPAENKDRP